MKTARSLAALATSIVAGALLFALSPVSAQTGGVVSVLYAGSLVTPMEGPIKSALASKGIDFQGQGAGSKQLANFIASGIKNPDIFISVDPKLVVGLGPKVASAETFAGTSLGLGWSDKSKYASLFENVAAGKTTALSALQTPGLKIGRTDPKLDPKGEYTVDAVKMLAGANGEQQILGPDENTMQTFPEEDLLARVDVGEADVGFFYKTEAVARGLRFAALPGAAAMSDKITYTIAVMKAAPHPDQAKTFENFIVTGDGKAILEKAGIEYLPTPRVLSSPSTP
ncbi:MAG: extracellular solute-binding protein [Candidatus Eremiobacteraeota bacterium]|nr:extracellular solute-binding protein [Candidatus Eremiobacteraeota bacterium]